MLLEALLIAQVLAGPSLELVVRDPEGLPLSGVSIRLRGEGQSLRAKTDRRGAIAWTDLAPGDYRIKVELEGFETVRTSVRLEPRHQSSKSVTLKPHPFSDAIVLVHQVPAIDWSSSTKESTFVSFGSYLVRER